MSGKIDTAKTKQLALDALKDILGGWVYIRETHGDMYGVGWDRAQRKAEAAISSLEADIAAKVDPVGRGYALLGTGMYVINHSAAPADPDLGAELIITYATESDKSGGRQVGESRDNSPDNLPIQDDEMMIRIGFLSERGLFALENQLSELRKEHFPSIQQAEAPAGYALAMAVLQSDLYHKLDDLERAQCDALIAANNAS